MKCFRCNELLNDGVFSCSKCGFIFDNPRIGNELSINEYQQLGVMDTFNMLVQRGVVLLKGNKTNLSNVNLLYSQMINNCNYNIVATFIGVSKIECDDKFTRYRKEMGTIGNDIIDKINIFSKKKKNSFYPIFRYEYNGNIYVSEGFYPIEGECPYVVGNNYSINIDPNFPNMMIYNNSFSSVSKLNKGVITKGYTFFVFSRFVLCFILFLIFIGTLFGNVTDYFAENTLAKNYVDAEAKLVNKDCNDDNLCVGEYDFYVKGILYSVVTEEPQKRLDETINIKYSPSDPYKYVLKKDDNNKDLINMILFAILDLIFLFLGIFHLKLFKKCIK